MRKPAPTHLAEPVVAYVGMGANLGDPLATLQAALFALDQCPGTQCVRRSSWYRSAPVQATGPDFVNLVVELRTWLRATTLFAHLQRLEHAAGRERPYRHAPRTLDLDLLHYGSATMHSPELVLPHPRWQARAFVLMPLCELAPERVSPACLAAVSGQTIVRLDEGPVAGPFYPVAGHDLWPLSP
jgi:2-amino-4-hydroxy-6-hydroxymethyldihydropteridine diphosphokinase